jgi:hypothetical protein
MILLDSRFCGVDLSIIGFPSVETCMAVVLETEARLVGWHAMNTGTVVTDAQGFGGFVQANVATKHVALYGVTHPSRKGEKELKAEMRAIARAAGYTGQKISVYLMPMRRDPQQDYVQFVRAGNGQRCEVHYVDQQEMNHTIQQVAPNATPHRKIVNGVVGLLTTTVIDDVTQKYVTSPTSPITADAVVAMHKMRTIQESDWVTFKV